MAPLAVLRARAYRAAADRRLTEELKNAICELRTALNSTPPRMIEFWSSEKPTLVFTDGAVENFGIDVTMGSVIVLPRCIGMRYFGSRVPEGPVREWNSKGSFHTIAQAE